MDIQGWNERYRSEAGAAEISERAPTKLVMETASKLVAGMALDLACGTGRNALWLASHGWEVTAIDGSPVAIESLRESARRARQNAQRNPMKLTARVADLKDALFSLPWGQWDLVAICYYLQRDLLDRAKKAVKPGGMAVVIVHTTESNEEPTESRLRPGELRHFFGDWEILHDYEGKPDDPAHKRSVAEIVARRPVEVKPS